MLQYDDSTHTYSEFGILIPSVTQVLSSYSPWYTQDSKDRGHEVHKACEAYARDHSYFPTEPYVDSFALWCFKKSPQFLEIESIIKGNLDGMDYAGRLDFEVEIDNVKILVDLKSGVKSPTYHAQIAAYAFARKSAKCLVLYLHDDMTYTEDWLSSKQLIAGIDLFRKKLAEWYRR